MKRRLTLTIFVKSLGILSHVWNFSGENLHFGPREHAVMNY